MTIIFAGLPAFGGLNYVGLTQSLLRLQPVLARNNIRLELGTVSNCASQPAARGYPMTQFLDCTEAEYYLSLDADVEFHPDQIMRLLAADFPLCAATYGTKKNPPRLIGNYIERPAKVEHGFVEMKDLGLGCVLAKRSAISQMARQFPKRVLHNNQWIVTWFFPFVDGQEYISCDGAFFWHWRQCGGRVWVDLQSAIDHWGTYIFPCPRFDGQPPVPEGRAMPEVVAQQNWSTDVGAN